MEDKKLFWPHAKLTNTSRRYDPGVTKYRQRFDAMLGHGKFRGLRRYKHPDGRKKITVEIAI